MKKDWIERELTVEIVVGVFMVVILLGLSSFTFVLSGKKWGQEKHEMTVLFSDVMGLKVRDSVIVRGMPLGAVTNLELDAELGKVRVSVALTKKLKMRKGYKIIVISTSILGGRVLDIFEGPEDSPELIGMDEYDGSDPHDLMADAAELVHAVKQGLAGEGGVIESLKETTANIKKITDRLNAGEGTIGKLLAADDTLYDDLTMTVATLRKVSEGIEKGEGTVGKLLSKDDQLYDDLSAAVASLKVIAARLEKGEGMIGKLMSEDNTLYIELEKTVKEARAAIDDIRETSPVVTFSSVFFGAF